MNNRHILTVKDILMILYLFIFKKIAAALPVKTVRLVYYED